MLLVKSFPTTFAAMLSNCRARAARRPAVWWRKQFGRILVALPVTLLGWLFVSVEVRLNDAETVARRAASLGGLGLTPYFVYQDTPPLVAEADHAALRHGVPPLLFRALIEQESGWNPAAVSPKGAVGLTQLMPATAQGECGLTAEERFARDKNLDCGARYLGKLLRRFGSVELALAAYNSGPTRVARLGRVPRITETRNYVARILSNWEQGG